jgi:hypothetical protein
VGYLGYSRKVETRKTLVHNMEENYMMPEKPQTAHSPEMPPRKVYSRFPAGIPAHFVTVLVTLL